jgi:RES domain-containing protein
VTSATDGDFVVVYRIATEAPSYGANDLSGAGARITGGRWNSVSLPVVYTSGTRALACLETVVHLTSAPSLPLNRFLVEIAIPLSAWNARTRFLDQLATGGWDAEPPGHMSIQWGSGWLNDRSTLLAEVPSVIVPEESNFLINPGHPDAGTLTARTIRRWTYDGRIRAVV